MVTDVDQTCKACARDDPLKVINFWCWSGSAYDSALVFHSFLPLQNWFLEISYPLSHSRPPIFTKCGETTDANKAMNPQHFGNDTADIRIRINPDFNPGSLSVHISALAEFLLSECFCINYAYLWLCWLLSIWHILGWWWSSSSWLLLLSLLVRVANILQEHFYRVIMLHLSYL